MQIIGGYHQITLYSDCYLNFIKGGHVLAKCIDKNAK